MSEVQRPFRDALLSVLTGSGDGLTEKERKARRLAYLDSAQPIAFSGNVYAALGAALKARGFAGDARTAALLYTVFSSRLLATPMSAWIKLPPDVGHRSPVDRLLELFPKDQVEMRSGFSAKAIAYGFKSLRHKVLVVREAGGLSGRDGEMLWRSLTPDGLTWEVARCRGTSCYTHEVRREGPLALVMMTSKDGVHPDGETAHALPLALDDDAEDSDAAIDAISRRFAGGRPADDAAELEPWRAFQEVLEANPIQVVVPFAPALGRLYAARDRAARHLFLQLLAAVATSALLHRFTREYDSSGAVIATLDDYAHARWMLEKPLADAVATGAAVPDGVQELLDVLLEDPRGLDPRGLDLGELAAKMNVDRTTAQRRAQKAKALGLALDLAGGQGRRCRWVAVERAPADETVLPEPRAVEAEMRPDEAIAAVEPADCADVETEIDFELQASEPDEELPDLSDAEPAEPSASLAGRVEPQPREPEPSPIEPTEPAPPRPAPDARRPAHISAASEPERVEPTGPEALIETPPALAPAQPSPATAAPPLPPIIAKAPNPKSLTGGYRLREHQFRFRAAMEEITGRKWQGAP